MNIHNIKINSIANIKANNGKLCFRNIKAVSHRPHKKRNKVGKKFLLRFSVMFIYVYKISKEIKGGREAKLCIGHKCVFVCARACGHSRNA